MSETRLTPTLETESARQTAELDSLRRMPIASQDTFSLSFAVCNSRTLRDQLIGQVCAEFPGIVVVALPPNVDDVLDFALERLRERGEAAVISAELNGVFGRSDDSEKLLRRALDYCERQYGANHPNASTALNNLAQLLRATNRLAEAESLMRRQVEILRHFADTTGHEHPRMQVALHNYRQLLKQMNLPDDEIQAALQHAAH